MIEENLKYYKIFHDEFIELFATFKIASNEGNFKNLQTYLSNLVLNANPIVMVTDVGIKSYIFPIFRDSLIRHFIEKLYYLFISRLDKKEQETIIANMSNALYISDVDNESPIPETDIVSYPDFKTINRLISSSIHMQTLMLIIATTRCKDVLL